jgi:hypothetical protein
MDIKDQKTKKKKKKEKKKKKRVGSLISDPKQK